MNEEISQLLVLQDRDSKATRLEAELESIDPEREKTRRDSLQAQQVLEQWPDVLSEFIKVMPIDYKRVLEQRRRETEQNVGTTGS